MVDKLRITSCLCWNLAGLPSGQLVLNPYGYPGVKLWQSSPQKVSLCLCGEGCLQLAHRSDIKQVADLDCLGPNLKSRYVS